MRFIMLVLVFLPDAVLAQSRSPGEPDRWLLSSADIDTTGLDPGYHEMIDIGVILTDVGGKEIDRLFPRIQPERRERTSDGARAGERARKNGKSTSSAPGDARRADEGVPPTRARRSLDPDGGDNTHFDAELVDQRSQRHGRS